MTTAQLMTDLEQQGIRIEAHGERLRYSPKSAVTPDLVTRMKIHKAGLLAILSGGLDTRDKDPINEMYRRINVAMPREIDIPEEFWCHIDPLQVEMHDAWTAGNAERVVDAIDNYETTVMEFFRQTVLARRASTR